MAQTTNDKSSYQPNPETIAAMKEAVQIEHDPSVVSFTTLEVLFAELKNKETLEME